MVEDSWKAYYRLTEALPPSMGLMKFLGSVPEKGCVLDFGCGTGRYALAFLRDRPDLTVDVLDRTLEGLLPAFEGHPSIGNRFEQECEQWQARPVRYDAIWANAVMFFMDQKHFPALMQALYTSLKPGGTLFFTHVLDCPEARQMEFNGTTEESLTTLLAESGFTVTLSGCPEKKYGKDGLAIPTFVFYVRKISH